MACEKNVTDLPLSLTYPLDTDLVIFTDPTNLDPLTNSVVRRWSTIKPVPRFVIVDINDTPANTPIEMAALNGVAVGRIINIIRTERSCRNIVAAPPSGSDIQYTESAGPVNASVTLSDAGFAGEWIKVIYI